MAVAGQVLLSSIAVLITIYADKYRRADFEKFLPDEPANLNLPIKETFDFIIVGGGTAGCVLADRLSTKFSVLVIEAGGNPPPLQEIPNLVPFTQDLPEINFNFKSTAQKNAKLWNGGVVPMSMGKMLGGTSSHNGMTYERGNPNDFDRWANVTNDQSWSYKNMIQFFKKMEKYVGTRSLSLDNHGLDGDLTVADEEYTRGNDIWLEAGRELGYNLQDSNSFQGEGTTCNLFCKKNGHRESSYTAFIKPIDGKRESLKIYRYSFATEVVFEEKRAVGVRFTRHGVPSVAFAQKEVILSAGTHISPLILIKSGIGPEDELAKIKKTPVSILPVGYNLMDHPNVLLPFNIEKPGIGWTLEDNLSFEDMQKFLDSGEGPLSASIQGSAGAFLTSTKRKGTTRDWPDVQLFYTPYLGFDAQKIGILVGMNAGESRGRITLNTSATSMEDSNLPIMDLNWFDKEIDFEVAIEGIEFAFKFMETKAFQNIGAKFAPPEFEACNGYQVRSKEYWKCYIQHMADTTWHVAGTCKMGRPDDPTAVVDSQLRVIGTQNLRVADGSIMPFVTNANTATPIMTIAEKAAHDILEQYATTAITV